MNEGEALELIRQVRECGGESTTIELKEVIVSDKVKMAIAAFANDWQLSGGGNVLLGVTDAGVLKGLVGKSDDILQQVSNLAYDGSIDPKPPVQADVKNVAGKQIGFLTVLRGERTPYRFKGKAYIRVGTTTRPATYEEERKLEMRSKTDVHEPVQRLFDVKPIQSRGENIFLVDRKGEPGGLDEFFVKVHFNLWTKYTIEIVNINLSYNVPKAMPGRQKISIDGPQDQDVYERLDASYRMINRRRVEERGVSNIFVSRRFVCNRGEVDYADYGVVTIDCEATSPAWDGIRVLTIRGKLEAGGEFEISEVTVRDLT